MRTAAHSVFEIYYHVTFQTKYRHKCITQEMLHRIEAIFRDVLPGQGCNLVEFNGESDHVHLVIDAPPQVCVAELVRMLKTVSSRLIRKEFKEHLEQYYWKAKFWSASYGVKSISRGADLEQIIDYVQKQDTPPAAN
jgi:putative transposase